MSEETELTSSVNLFSESEGLVENTPHSEENNIDGINSVEQNANDRVNTASQSIDEIDEEEITAQKVLEFLEIAWINELNAPEILPHQNDMLELMLSQVAHMEQNMADLDKNDFRYVIHQMELERIRYIMASYLRCRLKKIEAYTKHILNEEQHRSPENKYLSNEELQFAQEYDEHVEKHLHSVALQHIPSLQGHRIEERIVRPNLMSHVFVKANVDVPGILVGADDEEVVMATGSQHIINYKVVAELIKRNQLQLI